MSNLDIFKIEEKYRRSLNSINKEVLNTSVLFDLIRFYEELFDQDDLLLIEVYILESIDKILNTFKNYSVYGKPPEFSERVIKVFKKNNDFISNVNKRELIDQKIAEIEQDLKKLNLLLHGGNILSTWTNSISFPLLESSGDDNFGTTDNFNIVLQPIRNFSKDEFLIIPSLPTLDEKIESQLKISWNYAKRFISKAKPLSLPKFKIVIQYTKKIGFYTGTSNSLALTLGFIISLSNYLNLRKSYKVNNACLLTGVVNEKGEIERVSDEIIEKKVRIAFYSEFSNLIVPEGDFAKAEITLNEEKKKYPKRNITLITANNIEDILNDKRITSVERISNLKIISNFVISNKLSVAALMLLFVPLFIITFWSPNKTDSIEFVQERDFLEYAKAEYQLDEDKLAPISDMDEVLKINFDLHELSSDNNSKFSDVHNIKLVKNRHNEPNKAFRFDGKSSFIELSENKNLKCELPVSISIWFRKMNDNYGWLFTNSYDTSYYYGVFFGFISRNIPSIHFGNGKTLGNTNARRSLYSKEQILIGNWYHLVGVIENENVFRIYLNNRLVDSYYGGEAKTIKYHDGPIYLGKFNNSKILSIPFYKGDMDDFRLFNRVITEEEINILFHEK